MKYPKSLFRLMIGAIIAVMFGMITGCSQIDSGNVGVVRSMGKTDLNELPQGWHLTGFATVDEVTTKEVSFPLENLKPKAKDNLTIAELDVDIYFKSTPNLVADTSFKYQGDMVRHSAIVERGSGDYVVGFNRINREARSAVVKAVAEFNATEMHTKRTELEGRIAAILQYELNKSDPGAWTITTVNVRTLTTDPAIEKSIRAAAETDQAIARARKEKELAQIEAEKRLIVAQGEARANEVISSSLTPMLVRKMEIDSQRAFAGAGTHTVLMGGHGQPLISVGAK